MDAVYDKRIDPGDTKRVDIDFIAGNDRLRFLAQNSSDITVLNITSNAIADTSSWHHVLYSFDLSNAANRHIYIDDVSAINSVTTYNTAETIDFSATEEAIGQAANGCCHVDGDMADFWMDFNTYIDLSVAANRRQFIDASGWPVDLGTDGSKATGAVPDIYLSGAAAAWHTNKGTSGGFTENGALTDGITNPGENLGPTGGLVGWWKLDETAGTTAINGHDGTYGTDASLRTQAGIIGGGCKGEEDGSGAVTIPDHDDFDVFPGEILTFSLWVKETKGASWGKILEKRDTGSNTGYDFIRNPALDRWQFRHYTGANHFNPLVNGLDYGNWTHLVCIMDSATDTVTCYKNGVLENSRSLNDDMSSSTVDLSFCNEREVIDDVRFYDRALSATEITELYETGFPCKNPVAQRDGDTVYNLTHYVPQFCNLREWKAMAPQPGDGGAGCSNPTAVAGDIMYNSTSNVMQYCEGDTWKAMGKY